MPPPSSSPRPQRQPRLLRLFLTAATALLLAAGAAAAAAAPTSNTAAAGAPAGEQPAWTMRIGGTGFIRPFAIDASSIRQYANASLHLRVHAGPSNSAPGGPTSEACWLGGNGDYTSSLQWSKRNIGGLGETGDHIWPAGGHRAARWMGQDGNLYIYSGETIAAPIGPYVYFYNNDLWRYTVTTRQWVRLTGAEAYPGYHRGDPGLNLPVNTSAAVYSRVAGMRGQYGETHSPGIRLDSAFATDDTDGLWLYGGSDAGPFGSVNYNDVWRFSISRGQWAWMAGSLSKTALSSGFAASAVSVDATVSGDVNAPGTRIQPIGGWYNGRLYVFFGQFATSAGGYANDVWSYDPVIDVWHLEHAGNAGVEIKPAAHGESSATAVPRRVREVKGDMDAQGRFWIFGGQSVAGLSTDMWFFSTALRQWTWVLGSGDATTSVAQTGGPYTAGYFRSESPSFAIGARVDTPMALNKRTNALYLFEGGNTYSTAADLLLFNLTSQRTTWIAGGAINSNNVPPGAYYSLFSYPADSGGLATCSRTAVPIRSQRGLLFAHPNGDVFYGFGYNSYTHNAFYVLHADHASVDFNVTVRNGSRLVSPLSAPVREGLNRLTLGWPTGTKHSFQLGINRTEADAAAASVEDGSTVTDSFTLHITQVSELSDDKRWNASFVAVDGTTLATLSSDRPLTADNLQALIPLAFANTVLTLRLSLPMGASAVSEAASLPPFHSEPQMQIQLGPLGSVQTIPLQIIAEDNSRSAAFSISVAYCFNCSAPIARSAVYTVHASAPSLNVSAADGLANFVLDADNADGAFIGTFSRINDSSSTGLTVQLHSNGAFIVTLPPRNTSAPIDSLNFTYQATDGVAGSRGQLTSQPATVTVLIEHAVVPAVTRLSAHPLSALNTLSLLELASFTASISAAELSHLVDGELKWTLPTGWLSVSCPLSVQLNAAVSAPTADCTGFLTSAAAVGSSVTVAADFVSASPVDVSDAVRALISPLIPTGIAVNATDVQIASVQFTFAEADIAAVINDTATELKRSEDITLQAARALIFNPAQLTSFHYDAVSGEVTFDVLPPAAQPLAQRLLALFCNTSSKLYQQQNGDERYRAFSAARPRADCLNRILIRNGCVDQSGVFRLAEHLCDSPTSSHSSDAALSGGAIAGIVIGSLVFMLLLIAAYMVYRRCRSKRRSHDTAAAATVKNSAVNQSNDTFTAAAPFPSSGVVKIHLVELVPQGQRNDGHEA